MRNVTNVLETFNDIGVNSDNLKNDINLLKSEFLITIVLKKGANNTWV